MSTLRQVHARSAALSAVIVSCVLWSGCQAPSSSAGRIVGTWEGQDKMYRKVVTYHSDGTWAVTLQVVPPKKADLDAEPSLSMRGVVQALATGTTTSCQGTWGLVDGRLVRTVTGSSNTEIPAGLAASDEVVQADTSSLKLFSQLGETEVWQRVKCAPPKPAESTVK